MVTSSNQLMSTIQILYCYCWWLYSIYMDFSSKTKIQFFWTFFEISKGSWKHVWKKNQNLSKWWWWWIYIIWLPKTFIKLWHSSSIFMSPCSRIKRCCRKETLWHSGNRTYSNVSSSCSSTLLGRCIPYGCVFNKSHAIHFPWHENTLFKTI